MIQNRMKILAIICEFNPIHLGHEYIIKEARSMLGENGCLVCVMSGNFTQRCTPAVYDKYTRAECAAAVGADLVLELPFPWCSCGAENFAMGGCAIAARAGAEGLVFGSESGDVGLIERLAEIKGSAEFARKMRDIEKRERSRGSAELFKEAVRSLGVDEKLGGNDKLGCEYVLSGKRFGIGGFFPIKRTDNVRCATELREAIAGSGFSAVSDDIPTAARTILEKHSPIDEKRYLRLLFEYIRLGGARSAGADTAAYHILSYLEKTADGCRDEEEFFRRIPQKKYTTARLRREMLFSLVASACGVSEINGSQHPRFTTVLAANERGRAHLAALGNKADFAFVTKPSRLPATEESEITSAQYEANKAADRVYALTAGREAAYFIKKSPVMR